jgi:hypothetical protein
MEKSIETMGKSIEKKEKSMKTMEKSMNTLGKSMNTMEKLSKTMEKSMSSANGKFWLQNSAKYRFLFQNVANSKEKCPRLKNKQKQKKKLHPLQTPNIHNIP